MTPLQIFLIIFLLFALSRVFLRAKGKQISKKEFAFWAIVWLLAIVFVLEPDLFRISADLLGIGRTVDVIIYFGLAVLFYLNFRLYVKMQKNEEDISKLVRTFAFKKAKEGKKKR